MPSRWPSMTNSETSTVAMRAGSSTKTVSKALHAVIVGIADEGEIKETIGRAMAYFRVRRNHEFAEGSSEWHALARALARAERQYRSTFRPPVTTVNQIRQRLTTSDIADDVAAPPNIEELFDALPRRTQKAGKARLPERKWRSVIKSLTSFLGHSRAERVTRKDALRWKDRLLDEFSPKTVRDFYIATARSAFTWAVDNDLISANPFAGVKVRLTKPVLHREKGFTDHEAVAILGAAFAYRPASKREHGETVAAKRWIPILAAYTGARIGELAQLRAEDIKDREGIHFIRITPAAGTVKSGLYRDVPLHPHLVDLGFVKFARLVKHGPLFHSQGTARAWRRRQNSWRAGRQVDSFARLFRSCGAAQSWLAPPVQDADA